MRLSDQWLGQIDHISHKQPGVSLACLSDAVEHRQGQRQPLLFTLTFAVSVRNSGWACNLQPLNNIALVKLESARLEDNLVIHHKDLSRHTFIQERDSGQIEALDRDYVKASVGAFFPPQTVFSCPDLMWLEI